MGRSSEDAHLQSLEEEVRSAEGEARMVVPGIQALFGFQLIAIFSERFTELDGAQRAIHFCSLLLVGVAIALIIAPAAYHRLAERGRVSRRLVELASAFLAGAMAALALGISAEFYLAADLVFGDALASALIGLGVLLLFAWLWFVFPLRRRPARHAGAL
jgi:hypothetical protein